MKGNHGRMVNFQKLMDGTSLTFNDFENIGDKISSTSKIIQLEYEKEQLNIQINQLWNYLEESKEKQIALEVELENRNEVINSLICSVEQNRQNFQKLREHQNYLVTFINNIDESRSAIVAKFNGIKNKCEETFSGINQKLSELEKTENNRDVDVVQLREHIRQQEENLCKAMKTHCSDQQLLRETDKKLEQALQAEELAKAEKESFLKQIKEKEAQWVEEKGRLMDTLEKLRDKFSVDINEEKKLTNTIEEMRRQERIQFQINLRMQLEKQMKLEAHIRSLEEKLMEQKENISPNPTRTSILQGHKQLCSASQNSDAGESDFLSPNPIRTSILQGHKRLCSASQNSDGHKRLCSASHNSDAAESDFSSSITESLFKKRKFEVHRASAHTPIIKNRFFNRSPAVDSTSILTDPDDDLPNQTL